MSDKSKLDNHEPGKYIYYASGSNSDELVHAWDKYEQARNYDSQKRHERYLRDKAAGKYGLNPNTRDYNKNGYSQIRLAGKQHSPDEFSKGKETKEKKQKQSKQAKEKANTAGARAARAAEAAALRSKIDDIREKYKSEKEDERADAKNKLADLKSKLESKRDEVKSTIEKNKQEAEAYRESLKEKAQKDIETEKDTKESNIKKDEERYKKIRDDTTNPIREKQAAIRGRLDSMGKKGNVQEKQRLKNQLMHNAEQINKANAKYTDSLYKSKTEHTTNMRNKINTIRETLKSNLTSSRQSQKATATQLREELKALRIENQAKAKEIRADLKYNINYLNQEQKEAIANARGK